MSQAIEPSRKLTPAEESLLDSFPSPPGVGQIRVAGVLILEWLQDSPSERRTGLELHQHLNNSRPNWSTYVRCRNKEDLLRSVRNAASNTGRILHIECHGCEDGLGDGSANEFLTWEELSTSLQAFNEACSCNSMIFLAACLGFAGISALAEGPRAPAAALVGPTTSLSPTELFAATVAFHQTLIDGHAHLSHMTDSSTQNSDVHFEPESMAIMAFEVWTQNMIVAARPENRNNRISAARQKLMQERGFTDDEADGLLREFDLAEASANQEAWNHFFMLDRAPENSGRFGVNFIEIARHIANFHNRKL